MSEATICPKCGHMEFVEPEPKDAVNRSLKAAIIDAFLDGSKFGLMTAKKIFNNQNYNLDKKKVDEESKPLIEKLILKHLI